MSHAETTSDEARSQGVEQVRSARSALLAMPGDKLDRICRRHHVRVLTLFGSAADPSVDDPRDLDIGVIFEPGAEHDVLRLLDDLVVTLGTESVDILDAQRASETARRRAIADGIGLYESEPMARAFAVMAADAMFMETERMRRQALDSLLT